jgi:ubiquinone/menaquinone biosynthesis C-methylase UbiE
MTIARAAPTCNVVATDLAPGMVEAAKRRAEGVSNFRSIWLELCARTLHCIQMALPRFCCSLGML